MSEHGLGLDAKNTVKTVPHGFLISANTPVRETDTGWMKNVRISVTDKSRGVRATELHVENGRSSPLNLVSILGEVT